MKEIYRTTNPAEIAVLKSVFESAGIELFLFDEYANSLGVMGADYAPCRFMVLDEEYEDACAVLRECKLEPSCE
jgi:hypothetical protein